MKRFIVFFLLFAVGITLHAQRDIPVTPTGDSLRAFYLSLQVENLWLAGYHVKWDTGEADHPDATSGNHTHCSAFVAAACKKLGIYLLRPPEHKQILLANAQYEWLQQADASADGWQLLTGPNIMLTAQTLANQGVVVIAICKNPDDSKPGHAALLMPAACNADNIKTDGPFVIQAGTHNHNKIALKLGFKSHLTDWPASNILFYRNSHPLQWPG